MNRAVRFLGGVIVLAEAMVYTAWHPISLRLFGETEEAYYRRKYPELYVRNINDWTD